MRLAEAGVTGPFDGVLAAFVLAELADLDAGLRVIHKLLRSGAPLAVHERSVAGSLRSKLAWASMCWGVVIPVGGMVTGGAGFYRELWRAGRRFDSVAGFEQRLDRAGFVDLRTQTVPGWEQRIVHTWLGRRPAECRPVEPSVASPAQAHPAESGPAERSAQGGAERTADLLRDVDQASEPGGT